MASRLVCSVMHMAFGSKGLEFDSLAGQTKSCRRLSPLRCFLELCCPGAKPQRWIPPHVTTVTCFDVLLCEQTGFDFVIFSCRWYSNVTFQQSGVELIDGLKRCMRGVYDVIRELCH